MDADLNQVKINRNAKQIEAEIISNKKVGPYHHMVFAVGEIAAAARPGNFVALSVGGENSASVLRRAFAIYRATDKGLLGGTIELVVAPHGSGSKWLCSLQIGDFVNLIGPLGTAFGIPTTPANTMLIGGGYGSAPLFALAELLKNRGCRVDMVLGASTANKIYAPLEGKRSVSSLTLTTDDGTAGVHGQITESIPRLIREFNINKIAQDFDLVHQCSVEESMACGIGVCMTCVVPVKVNEEIKMLRTCIDGPVMDGSMIIWDKESLKEGLSK
jgi:dihydroorotate dehydrogenase electron transfer subunit